MNRIVPIYVGFDPREAVAYHVWCQSVIERSSVPVAFIPLHGPMLKNFDGQRDGTNAFIYSRFLVPYLCGYQGHALFVDGDMVVLEDIAKLWALKSDQAVSVVQHSYLTQQPRKYIGTSMEADNQDYPRKNWSSVVLWNCGHPQNRLLTPDFIKSAPGSFLHRFSWLRDEEVGELPSDWNALALEQDLSCAQLIHYTCGIPAIDHYARSEGADHWHRARKRAFEVPK